MHNKLQFLSIITSTSSILLLGAYETVLSLRRPSFFKKQIHRLPLNRNANGWGITIRDMCSNWTRWWLIMDVIMIAWPLRQKIENNWVFILMLQSAITNNRPAKLLEAYSNNNYKRGDNKNQHTYVKINMYSIPQGCENVFPERRRVQL